MSLIHIERQQRRSRVIPLTPLVDVLCCLLIFFMLSTNFARLQTLELTLPTEVAPQKVVPGQVMQVHVSNNGEIFLSGTSMSPSDLSARLSSVFSTKPDQPVMVMVADKVSVQTLVTVLDRINAAGGQSIAVYDWKMPKAAAKGAS